jgi:ribosomal protein S18 acetylase RimI-like enzyme
VNDDITLRPASSQDRPFVESVYFETQGWIIEKLFGWRGDVFESSKFREKFYHEQNSSIVVAGGIPVGWIGVERNRKRIHIDGIYLLGEAQNRGIGTTLLRLLLTEATEGGLPLTLSTAKINPAVRLYNRLGFTVTASDQYKLYMTWWPKGPLTIMPATEEDAANIAQLHHLVRESSMSYLPRLHTVEETKGFFRKVVATRNVLLAKTGGILIAYCAYGDGWIEHLYVHPDYQRLKVGWALLEKTMAHQQALRLWVFQRNRDAIRFYEKAGFRLVRETDGADNEEHEPDALYVWESANRR